MNSRYVLQWFIFQSYAYERTPFSPNEWQAFFNSKKSLPPSSLSLCRKVLVKAFVFIQVATCNFNPSPPNFKSLLGLPFSFYLCLFFCQFISPFYLPLRLSDVVLCQWNKWFLSDISFHPKNFFWSSLQDFPPS